MRPRLRISKFDNVADYSVGKRFRFAVIDLDRGKDYPVNFVCLLPRQVKPEVKVSIFRRVFGEDFSALWQTESAEPAGKPNHDRQRIELTQPGHHKTPTKELTMKIITKWRLQPNRRSKKYIWI